MKVYLDDVRKTPEGWKRCYWPEEVILLLEHGEVSHLSLDHDLGDLENDARNGYAVLLWLEKQVVIKDFSPPKYITVHSDNSSAKKKMLLAIGSIHKHATKWVG
jgi:hypothetical protein